RRFAATVVGSRLGRADRCRVRPPGSPGLALEFRREKFALGESIPVEHANQIVSCLTLIVGILPIDPQLQQRNRLHTATGTRQMGVKDTDDTFGLRYAVALGFVPKTFFELRRKIHLYSHRLRIALNLVIWNGRAFWSRSLRAIGGRLPCGIGDHLAPEH